MTFLRFPFKRKIKNRSIAHLYYSEPVINGSTLLDLIEKHSKRSYKVEDVYSFELKRLEELWNKIGEE